MPGSGTGPRPGGWEMCSTAHFLAWHSVPLNFRKADVRNSDVLSRAVTFGKNTRACFVCRWMPKGLERGTASQHVLPKCRNVLSYTAQEPRRTSYEYVHCSVCIVRRTLCVISRLWLVAGCLVIILPAVLHIPPHFFAQQPPVGQGLLIYKVSKSHTTTHHSR